MQEELGLKMDGHMDKSLSTFQVSTYWPRLVTVGGAKRGRRTQGRCGSPQVIHRPGVGASTRFHRPPVGGVRGY